MVDRLSERWQPAGHVVAGVLIGGFLIGWPWPLFHKMFAHAASTHDAAYGAAPFILVAVGNMLVIGLLFLVSSMTRFPNWLAASALEPPQRPRWRGWSEDLSPWFTGSFNFRRCSASGGSRRCPGIDGDPRGVPRQHGCRPARSADKAKTFEWSASCFCERALEGFRAFRDASSTGLGSSPFVTTDALRCCSGVDMGSAQPPR